MDALTILLALTATVITTLYLGALLSDKLPDIDYRFDRKPFNCRPCLTFHLTWLLSTFLALIACSWWLFVSGVLTAFVVFAVVKYIDNQKIEK